MDPAAILPIPPSLRVEALLLDEDGLAILASSEAPDAPCPLCGERADRVHGRAVRTLADLPWATLAVHLRVAVRKFFCDNPACAADLRRGLRRRRGGHAQLRPGATRNRRGIERRGRGESVTRPCHTGLRFHSTQ